MTTMKKMTTCGRREMRPNGRKTRDHGTAAWNDILTVAARSMPRASRRALARLGQKVTTKRTRDLPRAMAKSVNDRVPDPATRPASSGVWGYMPTVSSQGKPGR